MGGLGGETGASEQSLRACSACAGDYEDPDRTAWTPDEEEEDLATERAQDRAEDKAKNDAGVDGLNVEDANDDEFPAKGA